MYWKNEEQKSVAEIHTCEGGGGERHDGKSEQGRRPLRAQLMVPGFHGREQGCAVVGHESLRVCW